MDSKPERYPEALIAPMRADLTRYGVEEIRTAEEVDRLFQTSNGTMLFVINSICGCAASKARPAVGLALRHNLRPDRVVTAFAGADIEAVARVRQRLVGHPPSSPSIILFQDARPVWVLHRKEIEADDAHGIAAQLIHAFNEHCRRQPAQVE